MDLHSGHVLWGWPRLEPKYGRISLTLQEIKIYSRVSMRQQKKLKNRVWHVIVMMANNDVSIYSVANDMPPWFVSFSKPNANIPLETRWNEYWQRRQKGKGSDWVDACFVDISISSTAFLGVVPPQVVENPILWMVASRLFIKSPTNRPRVVQILAASLNVDQFHCSDWLPDLTENEKEHQVMQSNTVRVAQSI